MFGLISQWTKLKYKMNTISVEQKKKKEKKKIIEKVRKT